MAWIAVGTMALGVIQGKQKEKKQNEYNQMQSQLQRYGGTPQFNHTSDNAAMDGLIGGAMTGMKMKQNMANDSFKMNDKNAALQDVDSQLSKLDNTNLSGYKPDAFGANNSVYNPQLNRISAYSLL